MAYLHMTGEKIIHAGNFRQFISPILPDGSVGRHGLIPRNYKTHPVGSYPWATAVDFPLIDQGEWSARIKDMEANKSRLSDVRMTGGPNGGMIPSRDQNGKGYCWAHSGVSGHLLVRALLGMPYADLSAYSIACQVKDFADEGGWGPQGVDFQVQNGCATGATWPQQSMSRSNLTDAMKADAAAHKITGQWADLNAAQYDRKLTFAQNATLLLSRCPTTTDFNWWSHSVCGMDVVDGSGLFGRTRLETGKLAGLQEFEAIWAVNDPVTAGFGLRVWNSWGDSWSSNGTGILTGQHAIPDGGVGVRMVSLSP